MWLFSREVYKFGINSKFFVDIIQHETMQDQQPNDRMLYLSAIFSFYEDDCKKKKQFELSVNDNRIEEQLQQILFYYYSK